MPSPDLVGSRRCPGAARRGPFLRSWSSGDWYVDVEARNVAPSPQAVGAEAFEAESLSDASFGVHTSRLTNAREAMTPVTQRS
jgi:hypothetical protein